VFRKSKTGLTEERKKKKAKAEKNGPLRSTTGSLHVTKASKKTGGLEPKGNQNGHKSRVKRAEFHGTHNRLKQRRSTNKHVAPVVERGRQQLRRVKRRKGFSPENKGPEMERKNARQEKKELR